MILKSLNKSKLQMLSCCNFSLGSVFCHDNCVFIVWLGWGWDNIVLWPKISGSPQTSLSKMTSLVAANMSGKCPMSHQKCTSLSCISKLLCRNIQFHCCIFLWKNPIWKCHYISGFVPPNSEKLSWHLLKNVSFLQLKHGWKMSEHLGKHTWFWHHKHVWKFPNMEHTTPLQNVPMLSKISYHKHNWSLDTKTTWLGLGKDHVLSRARFSAWVRGDSAPQMLRPKKKKNKKKKVYSNI